MSRVVCDRHGLLGPTLCPVGDVLAHRTAEDVDGHARWDALHDERAGRLVGAALGEGQRIGAFACVELADDCAAAAVAGVEDQAPGPGWFSKKNAAPATTTMTIAPMSATIHHGKRRFSGSGGGGSTGRGATPKLMTGLSSKSSSGTPPASRTRRRKA